LSISRLLLFSLLRSLLAGSVVHRLRIQPFVPPASKVLGSRDRRIPHRIPRDSINLISFPLSFLSIIFTSYTIHQAQCNQKICTVHSQQTNQPHPNPHPANDVTVLAAGQQGSSESTDALIKEGTNGTQHQRSTTLKGPRKLLLSCSCDVSTSLLSVPLPSILYAN
jgi:hypothetical protein